MSWRRARGYTEKLALPNRSYQESEWPAQLSFPPVLANGWPGEVLGEVGRHLLKVPLAQWWRKKSKELQLPQVTCSLGERGRRF